MDFRRFIRIAIGEGNFSYFQLVGDVEESDMKVAMHLGYSNGEHAIILYIARVCEHGGQI